MVIVFDINGTLLDLQVLAPKLRQLFGSKLSLREFFKDVTAYAMATTLAGEYRPFEEVAMDVLRMHADAYGAELTDKSLQNFRKRLRSLPSFPDVKRSLRRLHDRGLRIAALSNSSESALTEQLKNAGIDRYFDHIRSVDTVQQFKPSREIYLSAAEAFESQPHELLMVAAHPWDLFGAAQAGCRTALITRQKVAPYPGGGPVNHQTSDLHELTNELLGEKEEKQHSNVGWFAIAGGAALALAGRTIVQSRLQTPEAVEELRARGASA